jgi:hypothetical protein
MQSPHNQVYDDDVYFSVKSLTMNNNILKQLRLENTGITDKVAKHLIQLVKTK